MNSLTLFLPAFNEAGNIAKTVSNAQEAASKFFPDYEILVINDGSSDQTAEIIKRLAAQNPKIKLIDHPRNLGYGAALKTGFKAATKELVFFTDGDGQFDIKEIEKFLPEIEQNDLVIGFRLKRQDPFHRLAYAKIFRLAIGILFGLWVKDIDCAFKMIKKKALLKIELKADGAMISSELLIKTKKQGLQIKEVGVNHFPRQAGQPTGGNLKVIFKAAAEIFKLWRELRR